MQLFCCLLKENPQFDANRCQPFCCDVTSDCLTNYLAESSADLATVIFCLSAVHPNKMVAVLENIHSVSEVLSLILFAYSRIL